MKKLIIISIALCLFTCKKEDSYPVYDLTAEERNWLVYNVNDTLVFYDSQGNGDVLRVSERREELVKNVDPYSKSDKITSKQFMGLIKITPLGYGFFQNDIIINYVKYEDRFAITIRLEDIFKNTIEISKINLKDTLIRDSLFKNCILLKNERGFRADSSFKNIVYSKDKGIVAITNYKNKLMVKGKWR